MTRLLFLGDSIGAASGQNFVKVTAERLRALGIGEVEYVNSSVNSSNVLDLLDRTQELLPGRAFDIAVVFVGINDSKVLAHVGQALVPVDFFAERLEDLAHRLEVAGIRVALCKLPALRFDHITRTHILDDYWHWTPDEYAEYNAAISKVATREGSARFVIDLEAAFREAGPEAELFESDGVHPSARGHAVIGQAVAAVIAEVI